jgi:hypothetical protein
MKLKKITKYLISTIIIFAFVFFAISFYSSWKKISAVKDEKAAISNEESETGKVLGEDAEALDQSNIYKSENYHMAEISLGSEAITFPAGQQSETPQISDMRSELVLGKSDQQVKFVLKWKTNKLCQSSIEYAKDGQSQSKTISEDGYGFTHSAEIAPLNFSNSYSYTVTARDKWGNVAKSDKMAFYTGAPNVSIFDLVGGAFKDMFGWANKK